MKFFEMTVRFGLMLLLMGVTTGSSFALADGYYEKILTCDGGAAVVDRNSLSPNYPQVVIRNPQIVAYLISQGVYASGNEIILTGVNDQPIYQSSDFHGFSVLGSESDRDWVRKEGQALRISFNRFIEAANSDCGHDIPYSDPSCQGHFREVASWYFEKCL